MTGEELRDIRRRLGFPCHDFARLLFCSAASIYRWEAKSGCDINAGPLAFALAAKEALERHPGIGKDARDLQYGSGDIWALVFLLINSRPRAEIENLLLEDPHG